MPSKSGWSRRAGARIALAALAAAAASGAGAVVGGGEDRGPLARSTLMVLNSRGGVCSGIVVARDTVLTAAHCLAGAPQIRVHFRSESGDPVLIEPSAKTTHPGFHAKAVEARRASIDLALLRLPDPLPARFETATLTDAGPANGARATLGGYGVEREGDARSTGTFRSAALEIVEPYGPSRILVWMRGERAGACTGDSGGPVIAEGAVFAVASWAKGAKGKACGETSQGVLLGPQRDWLDRTLQGWGRSAQWR